MLFEKDHYILARGESLDRCKKQVERFFQNTLLVKYDSIHFNEEKSFNALDGHFWPAIHKATDENRLILSKFVDELKETGFSSVKDLKTLPQGFPSKLLHIVTHILDGFIGIDSAFYNLLDDSHWVSDKCKQDIHAEPNMFWLLYTTGGSENAAASSLINT